MGQSESIDKLISKYSGKEGVTIVNLSPDIFQIMAGMDINNVSATEFPFDKLSSVKIIAIENEEVLKTADFYKEVTSELDTKAFAEVISVKDGVEDVRIWMKNEGKQIREFLLLVSSPEEGVVVYISGDFNMSDISGLAENYGGLDAMKGLENFKID
jgi:hypothetical protein